jgi:hypothetical protein
MRRLILIAAMLLASASAHATQLRSLSLASNDDPVIVDQSADQTKTVTAPQATSVTHADQATQAGSPASAAPAPQTETPKYVERPPAISTTTTAPVADTPRTDTFKTEAVKSDAVGPKPVVNKTAKADKARRRNDMTVARVMHELHRYGIYW